MPRKRVIEGSSEARSVASVLYRIIKAGTLPVWLPLLAAHPRLRGGLGQRFGRLPALLPEKPIWLHGSSAGDLAALQPLAGRLQRRGHSVVLSAWTRAGEQLGRQLCADEMPVLRAPLDLRRTVGRVLSRLRPRLLVLECLEIWPELLIGCLEHGVPVAVVNGRLSGRSLRRYARAASLFRPCFTSLAYVSALTDEDAARFELAGTAAGRIEVRTTTKHAGLRPIGALPALYPPRLVMGSIHAGEEQLLLDWLVRLREMLPLATVVAPRYPSRARALLRAFRRRGMRAELASRGGRSNAAGSIEILDTIGQLRDRYRGASLAFVGGSFVSRGGHNLVEPAACGVPVLFGPSTENCRVEAAALRAAGAGWEVHRGDDLWRLSCRLLSDETTWRQASRAGLQVATELASTVEPLADRLVEFATEAHS